MKIAPYLYCLTTALALAKPGLSTPAFGDAVSFLSSVSIELAPAVLEGISNVPIIEQEDNKGTSLSILHELLHIDTATATSDQQRMFNRIVNEKQLCSDNESGRMICLIDSLLRNMSRELTEDGITDVSQQVDTKKFDQFLARLLDSVDKDVFLAYFPFVQVVINSKINIYKDFYLWSEHGPEFQSFMKMSEELESMLVNHDKSSLSEIVSPFIISNEALKKKAIQKLVQSPSFQLKPIDTHGKFYDIMNRIKQHQTDIAVVSRHSTDIDPAGQNITIVIPLDRILNFNFVALPELNSTDISNVTVIIDQSNGSLFQFLMHEEELIVMNAILRSLLGDLLGVILDLPGKLFSSGGKGSGNCGELTITIGIGGGNNNDDYDNEEPTRKPRKVSPAHSTATPRKKPPPKY